MVPRRPRLSVLAALPAALALSGCLTIATINVDGHRAATYVVPLGGVAIERGASDAVGVKAIGLGLWRVCDAAGVGAVACTDIHADPRSCGVALLDGPPSAALARRSDLSRTLCQHIKEPTHVPTDDPIRSAGADRR